MISRFVVDANIIFNALLKQDGITNKLLFSSKIVIITPSFLLEELGKYKKLFEKKGIVYTDYVNLLLQRGIQIYPIETLVSTAQSIKSQMEKIDEKDIWYVSLAQKLGIPLWTNDKILIEKVNRIETVDTEYMIKNFL